MPPIGNQGHQSSCVAWSAGYYYKTWWEKYKHQGDSGWDTSNAEFEYSPAFIYNQINGGQDNGANFQDAFQLFQEKGAVDIAQFPYDQTNYTRQPDGIQSEAALQYRIPDASGTFGYFFAHNFGGGPYGNDILPLKNLLAGGKPLVLGIPIFDDFPDYGTPRSEVYVSIYNAGNPVDWRSVNAGGNFYGGHGVCIVGYNDNADPTQTDPDQRGAFLMLNSWGGSWNYGGKVWMSYQFVKDWVAEAWSMVDNRDSMPKLTSVSPSTCGPGQSVSIVGDNFGAGRRSASVSFPGGVNGSVTFWANGRITATVPGGAQSGQLRVLDWHGEPSNGKDVVVDAAASGWYLAEGATWPGFDEWVLIQNPNSTDSTVKVEFLTPQGKRGGPSLKVAATSRTTVHVNDFVPNNDVSTSVTVTSGQGICVERAMYVNARDGKWGAHDSIGTRGSAPEWFLPEGATWPGYDEWVLVMNPNDVPVNVRSTFQTQRGQAAGPDLYLQPGSRQTIHVNDFVPSMDVSTHVECLTEGKGVVAERAMYVNAPDGKRGCHESIGLTELSSGWGLAEGATWPGFEEWVLIANPTASPEVANVFFVTPSELVTGPSVTLYPGERKSLKVNDFVTDDVSILVFTEDSSQLCAVERAMYVNTVDGKRDAHDAAASDYMSTIWYLPEGCTSPGYDEWILVMNPDPNESADVSIRFMTPEGVAGGAGGTLPPLSRGTCHVNEFVTGDVSAEVRASSYVICERALYINASDGKAGATDSLAVLGALVNPGGSAGGAGSPLSDATVASLRKKVAASHPGERQSRAGAFTAR